MKTEEEIKKEIVEALRDGCEYSAQAKALLIHGAVEKIYGIAKAYAEQAIVEELIKAKTLTEHLNQESRNEYFDNRINQLK